MAVRISGTEWRRIFAEVAHLCSKLARAGRMNYRECMSKYLRLAHETGGVPEELRALAAGL